MSGSSPIKCQKCGKPLGYITINAKSFLEVKPQVDNVALVATCIDCSKKNGFYVRNF